MNNSKIIPVDERRSVIIPGDKDKTIQFCIEHFMNCYRIAVKNNNRFTVALSGGSTPKTLFQKLCQEPHSKEIDWKKLWLFWSDERCVGPDNPDSNYHMAMKAGFEKMPLEKDQVFRMKGEMAPKVAASEYNKFIQKHISNGFDLVMLGLGEDGHTASLFPNTEGLNIQDQDVISNYIPQKDSWRITLTFQCINRAQNIVFYVLGETKRNILKEVLSSSNKYPSQQVGTKNHSALFITDLKNL